VKRKSWTFWIGLSVILLITLNLPTPMGRAMKGAIRDLLAPLQELITSYSQRIGNAGDAIRGWGSLPEKVEVMEAELVEARRQVVELEELRRENYLLRQQLGFPSRPAFDLIPGQVLARDISGWWQTVRIQLGGGAPAAQENQAVISAEGLVGKVRNISGKTADILLISDPACRVSVRIEGKDVYAILHGQGLTWKGRVLCQIEFINKNVQIREGDTVVTSGLGGIFPPGIRVGRIVSVETDDNQLHQSGEVEPSVDLSSLSHVFIMQPRQEDLP
jgi:rod shape-determining protein MreC